MGHSEARARSLSDEVFWLRHALEVSKAGKEKLKARLVKLRAAGATLLKLPCDEAAQLRAALRRSRRQKTTFNTLRKENARLHRTVRKLETRKAALEVQPAKLRAIRKALESELAGLRAVGKTLSKSLSVADADLRRVLRRSRRRKAPHQAIIDARLEAFPKLSSKRLFDEVRAAGYPGCYSRVNDYVRATRPREPVVSLVRFETPAGHQGQVDFGTFTLPWGRRHALVIVLGYSRLLWLHFYTRQTMPVLMEGLESAFDRFSGVPEELLFDQMRWSGRPHLTAS